VRVAELQLQRHAADVLTDHLSILPMVMRRGSSNWTRLSRCASNGIRMSSARMITEIFVAGDD
jgi:hypothetical protein